MHLSLCCNSLATVCPYCCYERILCDYPYHCEGNPSFWQLSVSCCRPYVQAMAVSKPFCLGDRLGPINTNEITTRESYMATRQLTVIYYSFVIVFWKFFLSFLLSPLVLDLGSILPFSFLVS